MFLELSTLRSLLCIRLKPLIALLIIFSLNSAIAAQSKTIVKYHDKGYSPALRVYLNEVLKLALDKSTPEFGPYEIQYYSHALSHFRSKIETERGKLINLEFSAEWEGDVLNQNKVIQLHYPVFNGLLGLRDLLVTNERNADFSQISCAEEFKSMRAGLGAGWVDGNVLRRNDVQVVDAQLFDALFPMLVKGRYDYLPLGVHEAKAVLQTKVAQYDDITINPNLSIFYPMPMNLWVNAQETELADRMRAGYELAVKDGSLEALFQKHFGHVEDLMRSRTKKLIVMDAPGLHSEQTHQITEKFLDKYQSYFEVIN